MAWIAGWGVSSSRGCAVVESREREFRREVAQDSLSPFRRPCLKTCWRFTKLMGFPRRYRAPSWN